MSVKMLWGLLDPTHAVTYKKFSCTHGLKQENHPFGKLYWAENIDLKMSILKVVGYPKKIFLADVITCGW